MPSLHNSEPMNTNCRRFSSFIKYHTDSFRHSFHPTRMESTAGKSKHFSFPLSNANTRLYEFLLIAHATVHYASQEDGAVSAFLLFVLLLHYFSPDSFVKLVTQHLRCSVSLSTSGRFHCWWGASCGDGSEWMVATLDSQWSIISRCTGTR